MENLAKAREGEGVGGLLTVREAARRLNVHENTVRNMVARGQLKSVRLPGVRAHRFEVAEVERVAKARGRPVVEPLGKVKELADSEQLLPVSEAVSPSRRWSGSEEIDGAALLPKSPELARATDLSVWAGRRETQGLFPRLIRRLLVASPEVTELSIIRADEGVAAHGWDGQVAATPGSLWVPPGRSAWELGTDANVRAKAQRDYEKRTTDPLGLIPSEMVFVFATPRRWTGAEQWARDRRSEGIWRDVRVIDADRLEAWLEDVPPVHYWLSEEIGLRPRDALTLERWWEDFAGRTTRRIPAGLLLAGRAKQQEELARLLEGPPQAIGIEAGSRVEATAFFAASRVASEEEVQPGAIVVRSDEVWARLCRSMTPMVLVADFEDPPIQAALAGGSHVVVPLGREDLRRGQTIELPRIHRLLAQETLYQAWHEIPGQTVISFEEADNLAGLARRSLTSFIRRCASDPRMARPQWGDAEAAEVLAPLLLAGAWASTSEDEAAVREIADVPWEAVERNLRRWGSTGDPPFTRSANSWHLTSPEEAFDVLNGFITPQALERWRKVILRVLAETDPTLDLSEAERFAKINAERPKYSSVLRRGLARSMALLGAFGGESGPGGRGTFARHVAASVRELFALANADKTGLLWRSLSAELPLLAEAAPEVFLEAVDAGLSQDDAPLLVTMFRDSKNETAAFFASSPHTGLLWALETLCWSAELLPETLLTLARLASVDPGGRLGNRPAASVRAVLLPWVPYTAASVEERLGAFRQIRTRYPDVGWPLLLSLLPKPHDHSSPTSSPRFRDWKPDREGVTVAEWAASIEGLVCEALEMIADEPGRWIDIVDHLAGLSPDLRQRLLAELDAAIRASKFTDEQTTALWKALAKEVDHHREFPSAKWVMDDASLTVMEALVGKLTPSDPVVDSAQLFDWRPRLPDINRLSDNLRAYEKTRDQAQNEAVERILAEQGLAGVFRLALESPQPQFVGRALAEVVGDELADALLPQLANDSDEAVMAKAWVARRADQDGSNFVTAMKERVLALAPDAQAGFLRQLQPGKDLDLFLDEANEDVRDLYWRFVTPFGFGATEASEAARQFIAHDRPAAAIEVLTLRLHRDEPAEGITAALVMDALRAALSADPEEARSYQTFGYSVGLLISQLADLGATDQEIGQLEWAYFPMLENTSHPPTKLFETLKENPEFFVDLVSLVYRGKHDSPRDLDAPAAAIASNAWSVLQAWRDIPGRRDDGSIDRDHLHQWVKRARLLLEERDRADIGDEQIGQLLSASPPGTDGAWPAEPVRELIEDIGSRELETGLHIGRINSRGVTTRGAFDGGDQEKAIADGYRAWAAVTAGKWIRTTKLLRGLAESYDQDAQRLDAEAEVRGNLD